MDRNGDLELLSDSGMDIFRGEFPDHVVRRKMAVNAIHALEYIDDDVLETIGKQFNITKELLMDITDMGVRIKSGEGGTYKAKKPASYYRKKNAKEHVIEPPKEYLLLLETIEEVSGIKFMDPSFDNHWWPSRYRTMLAKISLDEIGLSYQDIASLTKIWIQQMYSARKRHKYLYNNNIDYRNRYNSILEYFKEKTA